MISPFPYLKPSLPIIFAFIIIMVSVVLVFDLGARGLSIMGHLLGIFSFTLLVFVVGIVLRHNPPNDADNFLVRRKGDISNWAARRKYYWKWLEGNRAIEFLLLYIGVTFGLGSLVLGLILAR